ncbi:MAG: glutathione S-transferase [Pseudomonadota bacterium]
MLGAAEQNGYRCTAFFLLLFEGFAMTDILYAAPLSLYSGKARAYMDWKNIDYREELSRPEVYRDVIIPAVGRPVIPVVQLSDDRILQDTTKIIDHYEAVEAGPSVYPETPVQHLVALLFESYGDEWLVIPAMHYRWNYNEEWVYGEFGKVAHPDGTPEEQYTIGKERGTEFKGFCPVLGINDDTIPAIEASYEALLAELDAHFASHDYLLGSRPSIGDYGLIGPLYAHLYRDPASGKIMQRLASNVVGWVKRMVTVDAPLSGAFLADDIIPETLYPILKRMMAEYIPWLQNVADMLESWARENADEALPRAVGFAPFTIEGTQGARVAIPFSLWMHQRPLDAYQALDGKALARAETLLDKVGGVPFRDFRLPQRVDFVDHEIVLAS